MTVNAENVPAESIDREYAFSPVDHIALRERMTVTLGVDVTRQFFEVIYELDDPNEQRRQLAQKAAELYELPDIAAQPKEIEVHVDLRDPKRERIEKPARVNTMFAKLLDRLGGQYGLAEELGLNIFDCDTVVESIIEMVQLSGRKFDEDELRQILRLRYIGLPVREISREIGMPAPSIFNRLFKLKDVNQKQKTFLSSVLMDRIPSGNRSSYGSASYKGINPINPPIENHMASDDFVPKVMDEHQHKNAVAATRAVSKEPAQAKGAPVSKRRKLYLEAQERLIKIDLFDVMLRPSEIPEKERQSATNNMWTRATLSNVMDSYTSRNQADIRNLKNMIDGVDDSGGTLIGYAETRRRLAQIAKMYPGRLKGDNTLPNIEAIRYLFNRFVEGVSVEKLQEAIPKAPVKSILIGAISEVFETKQAARIKPEKINRA